ncbi:MAG: GGDEF domain-containing protein [Chloroflexota bacterium]|nr:GGDEF domain-containing protein [Chloroflexota bacterium]
MTDVRQSQPEPRRPEDFLKVIPLFSGLPEVALRHLAEQTTAISFSRDAIICRQGDAGDSLFIVQSGEIEIVLTEGEDREVHLASLLPGEFFGELAVLDGEPRSATARTAADSRLLALRRDQLFAILREPNVLENLLGVLAKRVRAADQIVAARGIDNRRLEEEALTDALTGLGNRRKLRRDLEKLEAHSRRYGYSYAVGFIDVDNFKGLNDLYGHIGGDDVLRAVARTIAAQCRSGDEPYRYGGEEFLVVMPEQTEESAWTALERTRVAVEGLQLPHAGNAPFNVVTVSGGVSAAGRGAAASSKAVIGSADEALYVAKRQGRNRVVGGSGTGLS